MVLLSNKVQWQLILYFTQQKQNCALKNIFNYRGGGGNNRAANNFPAGAGQIVQLNLFLLGHIPFLAGQTSIIMILNP